MRQPAADCVAVGFMSVPCHSPMDTKPGRRDIYSNRPIRLAAGFQKRSATSARHHDAISHGDFNRIGLLYRYERRPSNTVEFCSSCWKMAKNAPFDMKSPVKKFHGRAKGGGHRTVPPLNTPLPLHTGIFPLFTTQRSNFTQSNRKDIRDCRDFPFSYSYGPISHRYWNIATYWKSPIFFTPCH